MAASLNKTHTDKRDSSEGKGVAVAVN